MAACPPHSCRTRAARTAAPGGPHALAATQGSSAAAAELWARLGAMPPVAASFHQLYKYDEMRTMLGVMGKSLSKAKLSQRLEQIATSPGSVPTGSPEQVAEGRKPSTRARVTASRRGKDTDGQERGGESDPPAPTRRCTQTLARGWYTPKYISSPTAAATKAVKTGDVVWCKLGDAPWWPALVAVRDCPSARFARHDLCMGSNFDELCAGTSHGQPASGQEAGIQARRDNLCDFLSVHYRVLLRVVPPGRLEAVRPVSAVSFADLNLPSAPSVYDRPSAASDIH